MARLMRVRCIDNRPFLHEDGGQLVQEARSGELVSLTVGKIYSVLSIEKGWYRVVDDTDEDYLYPPSLFEVVQPDGRS
ncbi:MAG TPA: hypothetical protein VFQ61_04835 [Polyangiaceae bacterium]|nr:hypothetical protein [Polyangiaceae bacterium]